MLRLLIGVRRDVQSESERRDSLATGMIGLVLILLLTPFLPGDSAESPEVAELAEYDVRLPSPEPARDLP